MNPAKVAVHRSMLHRAYEATCRATEKDAKYVKASGHRCCEKAREGAGMRRDHTRRCIVKLLKFDATAAGANYLDWVLQCDLACEMARGDEALADILVATIVQHLCANGREPIGDTCSCPKNASGKCMPPVPFGGNFRRTSNGPSTSLFGWPQQGGGRFGGDDGLFRMGGGQGIAHSGFAFAAPTQTQPLGALGGSVPCSRVLSYHHTGTSATATVPVPEPLGAFEVSVCATGAVPGSRVLSYPDMGTSATATVPVPEPLGAAVAVAAVAAASNVDDAGQCGPHGR